MMAQVVKQYKLNYFSPDENSNKVWIGLAYDDGAFETRFGRVRDGANLAVKKKTLSSKFDAEHHLEKKRNEKIRKGYKDVAVFDNEIETVISNSQPADLSKIAAEQIAGASEDSTTSELIKYLAEVNIHHITHSTSIKYNAANATFSTPLGVLTPQAIGEARVLLNEILSFNQNRNFSSVVRNYRVRDYFQLVPKDFGVKIPAAGELLATSENIAAEVSLLDALDAAIKTSPDANTEKLFECRLSKVPHWTEEGKILFRKIRTLFESTRNAQHHAQTAGLKLVRLYEVEVSGMKSLFDRKSAEIGNVREDLWHGSKASNLLSILKNGLIIPPASSAHCTGRMFGNGIYTSLQSTKALNYATDYWNGSGARNQRTFMFLCQAALGKTHKPRSSGNNFPFNGTDSTWVEPGTAGVMNHECIVYETGQINLRYLAEFGTA